MALARARGVIAGSITCPALSRAMRQYWALIARRQNDTRHAWSCLGSALGIKVQNVTFRFIMTSPPSFGEPPASVDIWRGEWWPCDMRRACSDVC
eukprot:16022948-Heterocapsa_arctica.AAC.1